MKQIIFTFFTLFIGLSQINAQVGVGTNSPHSSAALDIKDSTRGILIPRLSATQRLAINNPAVGLLVFQLDAPAGFWYFNGSQWQPMTATGGGKNSIIFTDTISNARAQLKLATDFGPNTQEIKIIGCTALTQIDLSAVTSIARISIEENPVLQQVNLGNLKTIEGDGLLIRDCPALNSLNLSGLETAFTTGDPAIGIAGTALSNITLPALRNSNGNISISENSSLVSLSLPLLQKAGALSIFENFPLQSVNIPTITTIKNTLLVFQNNLLGQLSFPQLVTTGGLYITYNSSLTGISFPALTAIADPTLSTILANCTNLSTVSFNNLSVFKSELFDISYCKLPPAQVDYLLNKFAT